MTRIIRPYEARDLLALLAAWENASRLAHAFLDEGFFIEERRLIPELYLPQADTWVAEVDGRVIGFISLLGHEVGGLFVQPAYHRTGAGRALMDKARALHGDLEVEVFEANEIGRRFYHAYGFQPLSRSIDPETGQPVLRLKYTADKSPPLDD